MALYIKKDKATILREALATLQNRTPITAVGPGSVARAFTEAISNELGDLYDALDFNLSQSVLSTASGRALDMIGELYNVRRRTLSDVATIDAGSGTFYFYIDSPIGDDIIVPAGVRIYTNIDTFVGRQTSFTVQEPVAILAGKTRAYASIRPTFQDAAVTVGSGKLTVHDFPSPSGVRVNCTNPKPVAPQLGYESDANYRIRIQKQIRVTASGTLEALRFAGLGISGVRDIRTRQAAYGAGTFELMVVAENPADSAGILARVEEALRTVRPIGVRMVIRQPDAVPVDITAVVITDRVGSAADAIVRQANFEIKAYINSLLPGDAIVYNRLIDKIFNASEAILDVQITSYAPNGVEAIRKNFIPKEYEQLIPGRIQVSLGSF